MHKDEALQQFSVMMDYRNLSPHTLKMYSFYVSKFLDFFEHKDILSRCLQTTVLLPKCQGVSVFCYGYFYDPVTGQPVEATEQERENFLPVFAKIRWSSG